MAKHLWVLSVLFMGTSSMAATHCPAETPALEALDVHTRLAFIAQRLNAERAPAQRWSLVFGGGFGVGILAQVAATSATPDDKRINYWVGAAGMGIGFLSVNLGAMHAIATDAPLAEKVSADADPGTVCQTLADAEWKLQKDAAGEKLGHGTLAHVANVLVNAGLLLWLGFGYGHWGTGFLNFGVGMVVGETLILTQPHALPEAYERYRIGRF